MAKKTEVVTESRYDSRGILTLDAMRDVISGGGNVLFRGRRIATIDDLPTPAELAEGDEDAEKSALSDIERQQKALDAQKARLAAVAKSRGKVEKIT